MDMKKGNLNTLKTLVVQAIASMGGGAVRVRVFALFVLIFLAISAFPAFSAETINLADYVSPEYGHKDTATDVKYYKFDTSSENIVLVDGSAENHDFAYYIDDSRLADSVITVRDNSDNIDKDFFNLTNSDNGVLRVINGNNKINGDFVENHQESSSKNVHGGAVYLASGADIEIYGNFIGNYNGDSDVYSDGGAIYNSADVTKICGDFIGNHVDTGNAAYGGAIFNSSNGTIDYIDGNFIGNYTEKSMMSSGAAICNHGLMKNIDADFVANGGTATNRFFGVLANAGEIHNINGDFINNRVSANIVMGAAISNYSDGNPLIKKIEGNFINNSATGINIMGVAIYNNGIINEIDASFINNHGQATQLAVGGAIYTNNDLNITADNKPIEFSGNYTQDRRGEIPNAIFVATSENSSPTITLNATNNGTITFNDQIDGGTTSGSTVNRDYAYNLTLTGDKSSKIVLNNDIINANIQIEDTNVFLSNAANFAQSKSLDLSSGTLNIALLENEVNFKSFSNAGTINIATVVVDAANKTVGKLSAETYGAQTGSIIIDNIRLISEPAQQITEINFADPNFSQNVSYTGIKEAYYPIFKYDINYNSATGNLVFNRSFNPAVLASSVAQTAGTYISQLHTYNLAFEHLDYYMNFPRAKRLEIKNKNKTALFNSGGSKFFNPKYSEPEKPAFWVKNYASFESVPLSGGVDVNNINYGTIIGHDSEIEDLKNGWQRVITAYIGYNGSSQRYLGVDAYQNGGSIGTAATFYKNNFFNATTIAASASSGDANTMFGRENFAILAAGIANKTGYNFEFARGRFIVQPNFLISYTYLNTFDYTNAAGVTIDSDPLNALQLTPGIKFIANTKSGWQPYIAFSVVWNIMDKSKVTANEVRIPSLGINPYVQYGIGIQKQPTENLTAYAQTMIHNGGRNGVSLSFGIRWAIGKKKQPST